MSYHELSEDEKLKITAQVDYFMDLVAKKYEVKPNEILDAVKWVNERKAFTEKFKSTTIFSLLSILLSAVLFSVWEGIKAILHGAQK